MPCPCLGGGVLLAGRDAIGRMAMATVGGWYLVQVLRQQSAA
jgi:hypothetical protein